MKPGYLTSEFLLTVTLMVCATVALVVGAIDADKWMVALTGGSVGYSLSRGIAKKPSNTTVNTEKATVNTASAEPAGE